MYTTSIIFIEENLDGKFTSEGHEYRVETNEPFSHSSFEDILFQALEIERIYSGCVLVQISKELDGEYISSDECIVEVHIKLTSELSPFIDWSRCGSLPPIYKINRDKSSYVLRGI